MTIKPVQKNEDDVEKTTSHRTSPKITVSKQWIYFLTDFSKFTAQEVDHRQI